MKTISGWGNRPVMRASEVNFNDLWSDKVTIRGNGRSYGDAAIGERFFSTHVFNHFLSLDLSNGVIEVESGVLLSDILKVTIPKGWTLPVTPGSSQVSVGGAICADVHGKNHHRAGCFSEYVISFSLELPSGERICCSRSENTDWFRATCGGMGLTGVIIEAKISLAAITSRFIETRTFVARSLEESMDLFVEHRDENYSVAWIDCIAKKKKLGRSLVSVGRESAQRDLDYQARQAFEVPFYAPEFALNSISVKAFNTAYFANGARSAGRSRIVDLQSFFYPLDVLHSWNKIYGRSGFYQLQFILPLEVSREGLTSILTKIASSGNGSFLAVLKLYGPENNNWLSFPMEGYSLALDFKYKPAVKEMIERLMDEVIDLGGRVYLAKDALMSKNQFDRSYAMADFFREFRAQKRLVDKVQTCLSRRLEL